MISAFGVEHGAFSKSFVNGKWVKATELSAKQAGKVKSGGQYLKAKGPTKSDTKFKQVQTTVLGEARQMKPGDQGKYMFNTVRHSGLDSRKNAKIDIQNTTPKLGGAGGGVHASAQKFGANRGGVNLITTHGKEAASPATLKHEQAHLAPKRSGYRSDQIARNPAKAMREEARADATADKALNRPSPFGRGINEISSDPHASGYAEAALGRHLSRSSEHVGSTRAGRAAKKVPGLRRLVRNADESVRGQYDAQIVRPALQNLNSSMKSLKKPVKRKHLDDYKSVYERAR